MSLKEISVDHSKIRNPQTITGVVEKEFAKNGIDIHRNECVDIKDDHSAGKRIYKLKNVKYFGSWKHRG
jgi:hypothetical protein